MSFRRFASPTAVVNGNGVLWAVVVLSGLIVGTSSLSALDDEVEGGGGVEGATDLGDRQTYAIQDDDFGRLRPADNERKQNMKKLLLLALLKLAKENREQQQEQQQAGDSIDQLNAEEEGETSESHVAEQKRGRWQGFCFRKSRSGRIHPYICWKGSDI